MEKFMQRENAYNPGYAYAHPQGNSPKASEDLDFNDVFGGPPRRFSTQEVRDRYSFGEAAAAADYEEERAAASSPWSGLKEKPVFGEESTPRRSRNQGEDFFDDIFKGGESSSYSSPRRTDRDNVFGSNPGSRVMSPARPLPPKADPFGTSLSPAQFSLPARLTKAMELPTFGSHNQYKLDGSTNGLNSPHYSCSSPLSRFSNQAIRSQFETRNEVHHQSPLSYDQVSIMSEENSLSTLISDQKDYNAQNSNKETRNVVDNINGNEFHFSIYKWAGRGVPMLMNFVVGNNLKSKDNRRYDKSASSNGRMESKSSTVRKQALSAAEHEALRKQHVEEELRSKGERKELTKALHEFSELNSLQNMKEEQVKPLDESDVREKIEKEVPVKKTESLKSELKPLDAFHGESENPPEMKDKKTRTPGVHADASNNKTMREKKGVGSDSSTAKVRKSINLGVSQGKSVAKGKVKEFVQIFNQEADSRPKADLERSRGSRWRNVGADQKENYVSSNAAKAKKHVNLHNDGDKKPDISFKVDENPYKDEAQQHSPTKTQSYKTSNNFSTKPQKTFSSEALDRDSKISAENSDDSLEDNFLVQELSDGHENVAESESSESEDIKAIDAKIRQWSVGKKGNIRSLLSTLQYVLWTESGWKPVPLVDLIEANSVKRAYQKALLRLHPDKLQQKGAAFHHKYVAEKVFDILQEAWDHFNTCSIIV